MAKFKPKKSKKAATTFSSNRAAIPCLVLILLGIGFMTLLFYFFLQSAAQ